MTVETGKPRWWRTTDEMIEKWLKDRQNLLVLYYQLFESFTTKCDVTETPTLTQFCEALIDYVSFGHFRVFEKLAESEDQSKVQNRDQNKVQSKNEVKNNAGPFELDKNLIVNILRTTLEALDFNDKYAEQAKKNSIDFEKDLSRLGEQIANRLDWEDELINQYLQTTRQLRALEV